MGTRTPKNRIINSDNHYNPFQYQTSWVETMQKQS